MQITVEVPDDIGKYILAGNKAGHYNIAKRFNLSERKSRFYATLGHITRSTPDTYQPEQDRIVTDYRADAATLTCDSLRIDTLDKALKAADVDMDIWEVDRHVVNSWPTTMKIKDADGTERALQVTNHQVKVWLKPKAPQPLHEAMKALIESLPTLKMPTRRNVLPKSDYAAELAPYDLHMGKFAWGKETGQGDMDLDISRKILIDACEANLNHLSAYPISKIFYILGNDLMHFENYMAQTSKGGNHLDVDSRLPKAIQATVETVLQAVRMCEQMAPVEIIWIPGNHDMHASYWLSETLKHHFVNNPYITVDNGAMQRKARLWGKLLVAWTHDASGRKAAPVVNMLPQFWPELWGKSVYREWHTGHKHKKEITKYAPVHTVGGVVIRQIPALSTIDFWHFDECFVDAVPAGESFLWHKNYGIQCHFTANAEYS